MNILLVLVPVSLLLIAAAIGAFFWAVDSGQFDDLESPSIAPLVDDDAPESERAVNSERTPDS